jgi:hypothetical protein
MHNPVCAIAGVGEGNGAALARAFSNEGIPRQPRSAWTFEIEVRPGLVPSISISFCPIRMNSPSFV